MNFEVNCKVFGLKYTEKKGINFKVNCKILGLKNREKKGFTDGQQFTNSYVTLFFVKLKN